MVARSQIVSLKRRLKRKLNTDRANRRNITALKRRQVDEQCNPAILNEH